MAGSGPDTKEERKNGREKRGKITKRKEVTDVGSRPEAGLNTLARASSRHKKRGHSEFRLRATSEEKR